MAGLDSSVPQPSAPAAPAEAPQQSSSLSKEEELDLRIAVKTAKKMMTEGGGLKAVETALKQSEDPAKVVGQFLSQLILQMHDQFPKEINVSPRIYLAEGGVLEQLLDFLEGKLGLPKEFSNQVFADVVEIFKAGAQGQQAQPQQQAAAPGPGLQGQVPPAPAPQPGVA